MAPKGFKSTSIPTKLYDDLKRLGDSFHRTVPETIEYLLLKNGDLPNGRETSA